MWYRSWQTLSGIRAETGTSFSVPYRSGEVDIAHDWVDWNAPGYRLPTEAEWEKACRGRLVDHHYPWTSKGGSYGDHITGANANYINSGDPFEGDFSRARTSPTAYYRDSQTPHGADMANGYGIYDMAGNLAEWCWDYYHTNWYAQTAATYADTRGPTDGTPNDEGNVVRVLRGGRWDVGEWWLRCSTRDMPLYNSEGYFAFGFRCVRAHR